MTDKPARNSQTTTDYEARKRRALRRLGCDHPACRNCGDSDWRRLELHHIAGRASDPITVILCKNCHAVLTDMQSDHPPIVGNNDDMLQSIGRLLIGLADFLEQLCAKLREFGKYLIELANTATVKARCSQ